MRLKLDENLGKASAELLEEAGHDVTTVPEQGLSSAPDRQVIKACQDENRCLVTLDLDFGNPLIFSHAEYSGIAVVRLPGRATPEDFSVALRTLIRGLERENIEGKLWIVQFDRIREYQPEDGSTQNNSS